MMSVSSALREGGCSVRDYRYYQTIFAGIPKPFAFVDLDLLGINAQQIRLRSQGKMIRIASKSIRSVELLKHLLEMDDCFRGIMCYSAPEALHLANHGLDDLLLGYPIWEPVWLEKLAIAVRDGHAITFMVDSVEHAEHLEKFARQFKVRLPVCLDADMSTDFFGLHFGVWRSSVRSIEQALYVLRRIVASNHLEAAGLMGYEAQIAGVGDRAPGSIFKNIAVRMLKHVSRREIRDRRALLLETVRQMGISLRFFNGGGTGSLHWTGKEDAITEVTAGSGFFAPGLFDHYIDFRCQPAAGYAVEIVRKPAAGIFTCAGGGFIASGSAGRDKLPKPYLPKGASLLPNEGAGEVQTPVRYRGGETLQLGDPIFFRHAKAGELCEHFTRLYCVSDGRIVKEVTTYRGDGLCQS